MNSLDVTALRLGGQQLIEASAGTGKTHAITHLFLRLVLERQLPVDRILVVTFTKAATDELRGRIRERLAGAARLLTTPALLADEPDAALRAILAGCLHADDSARRIRHLQAQLGAMDDAAIFTIHGFCQRALAEYAFESGQLFDARLEKDTAPLLRQAATDWWRRTFYPSPELARLALHTQTLATPDALLAAIRLAVDRDVALQATPFDAGEHARLAQETRAAWRQDGATLLADIRAQTGSGLLSKSEKNLRDDVLQLAAAELDAFCADTLAPLPGPHGLRLRQSFIDGCRSQKAIKAGSATAAAPVSLLLDRLAGAVEGREHALIADAVRHCRAELQRLKEHAGILGFDDLIRSLRDALQREDGAVLAARIARQYPAVLIDEFQDTDPAQYEIFRDIYARRDDTCLLMIGDPKQAIYSFRGADIFAYIGAKQATPAEDRHTLDVNWRSVQPLVNAVNGLFARLQGDAFLFPGAIDFSPVDAAGRADKQALTWRGERPVPLLFDVAPAPEEKTWNKAQFQQLAAASTAARIAALLADAAAGNARIGTRTLELRDIAVLVRTHDEGALVQEALRARGVGSAISSQHSVYATREAEALALVLAAVLEPASDVLLRRALACSLWRLAADELAALGDDDETDRLRARMLEYHRQWQQQGFMPMFRHWLHREGIPARLERPGNGERALTNLLHLAELLQAAAREHPTPESLLKFLARALSEPAHRGEEQQLRLESDENLVQIVTQHKSKGLQYPVVFLPFLATGRKPDKDPPTLWHDAAGNLRLELGRHDEAIAAAAREQLAEDIRLAYVALTRAQYLCVVAAGAVSGGEYTALTWLLHGSAADSRALTAWPARARALDHATRRTALLALADTAPQSFAVAEMLADSTRLARTAVAADAWQARPATRRVRQAWQQTSFSALAERRDAPVPAATATVAASPAPMTATGAHDIAAFPRGRNAGNFFHALFENIEFPEARGERLQAEIRRQLQRYCLPAHWLNAVESTVANVLDTPLDQGGFTLRTVTANRRRNECEFYYDVRDLRAGHLDALLPAGSDAAIDEPLRFAPVDGIMHGYIDLVFEQGGRYYLADWKSNWLGASVADYDCRMIAAAIRAHRYDLQYSVYTVALHRYLAARLPGYDYDKHFGGVWYFFLRGMQPANGARTGVFFRRADRAEILALDNAMRGGRQP